MSHGISWRNRPRLLILLGRLSLVLTIRDCGLCDLFLVPGHMAIVRWSDKPNGGALVGGE